MAAGRARGAGDRRPLVRALAVEAAAKGTPVRPLRRRPQPGLRRHRRRGAGRHDRRRGDGRAGRPLRRQGRDHVLLGELGRPHRVGGGRRRRPGPVPGLGRRSVGHALAVPRLVGDDQRPRGGEEARPRRPPGRSTSSPAPRAGSPRRRRSPPRATRRSPARSCATPWGSARAGSRSAGWGSPRRPVRRCSAPRSSSAVSQPGSTR